MGKAATAELEKRAYALLEEGVVMKVSYRPTEQEVAPHLSEIIEVLSEKIPELSSAIIQRNLSGEWREEHISELNNIQWGLMQIHARLKRMEEVTW